ncbi:MAG: CDP-diacylglycerol--serine O-phosphatidyltransferase [Verrucomicrobiota bacterium]
MNTNPSSNGQKKVFLLPNLMTAGNLFCGFMAVLQIFQGSLIRITETGNWAHHYENSLFLIFAAFIFDLLDGRLARLGGQESPFGREFDSLADLISFGIAPALLVFQIVLYELPDRIGWMIAFVYLACGAMRLARFNVHAAEVLPGSVPSKNFTGFPIPAAAGVIASITMLLLHIYKADHAIGNWKYLLAGLMLFLSFMMFSKYQYPSFKTVDWRTRWPLSRLVLITLFIAVVIIYYRFSLALVFTAYLLYGFLRPYLSLAWRKEIEEEDQDSS